MLLPNTTLEVAQNIGEQLIRAIARLTIDPVQGLSASLGVAPNYAAGDDLQHLMNVADKALYRAKAMGRNQVAVAS